MWPANMYVTLIKVAMGFLYLKKIGLYKTKMPYITSLTKL
jgi:hypothetical protein